MWHLTPDTWYVTGGGLVKFQPLNFYGLGVNVHWRYFHKGWFTQGLNQWQSCLLDSPGYTGSVNYLGRRDISLLMKMHKSATTKQINFLHFLPVHLVSGWVLSRSSSNLSSVNQLRLKPKLVELNLKQS